MLALLLALASEAASDENETQGSCISDVECANVDCGGRLVSLEPSRIGPPPRPSPCSHTQSAPPPLSNDTKMGGSDCPAAALVNRLPPGACVLGHGVGLPFIRPKNVKGDPDFQQTLPRLL